MKWLSVVVFFTVFCAAALMAEESAYDVLVTEPYREETGLEKAIRFYQENISTHDGAQCLYYPTCSAFYREAVREYGFIWGTIMIIDRMVHGWQPDKPVFMLGHSMGGAIATAYALQHQDGLTGLVLSAAALDTGDAAPPIVMALARFLSKVAPKMGTIALDPTQISRDPAVVQAYVDDPLVYGGKITARLATELMATAKNVAASAETIVLPTLIMHGSADKMVNARGSQQLYEAIGSTDKTIHMYDGFFHEICNEPECSMVLNDISQWLDAHIGTE